MNPPRKFTKKSRTADYLFGHHAIVSVLQYDSTRASKLLVQKGLRDQTAVRLAQDVGVPVDIVEKAYLNQKHTDGAHQGLLLECKPFAYTDLKDAIPENPKRCLVLDGITDARNLGRAIRSSFAFGCDFVVVPKDRSAGITPQAEKSAVGCAPRIPIVQATNLKRVLEQLKEAGYWVLGTSDNASKRLTEYDFSSPTAIVIGNEEKGMRDLTTKTCDALVQIPMSASDMSLNAADAAVVVLYESGR